MVAHAATAYCDGANGLWAAAGKALPSTRQQRCWLHKVRNVLDKLPEKQKPRVHADLRSIVNAPSETEARNGIEALAKTLQRDYPKPPRAYAMTSIAW